MLAIVVAGSILGFRQSATKRQVRATLSAFVSLALVVALFCGIVVIASQTWALPLFVGASIVVPVSVYGIATAVLSRSRRKAPEEAACASRDRAVRPAAASTAASARAGSATATAASIASAVSQQRVAAEASLPTTAPIPESPAAEKRRAGAEPCEPAAPQAATERVPRFEPLPVREPVEQELLFEREAAFAQEQVPATGRGLSLGEAPATESEAASVPEPAFAAESEYVPAVDIPAAFASEPEQAFGAPLAPEPVVEPAPAFAAPEPAVPAAPEPFVSGPSVMEPIAAEPAAPVVSEPAAPAPSIAEPASLDPDVAKPEPAASQSVEFDSASYFDRATALRDKGLFVVAARLYAECADLADDRAVFRKASIEEIACYGKADKIDRARELAEGLKESAQDLTAVESIKLDAVLKAV